MNQGKQMPAATGPILQKLDTPIGAIWLATTDEGLAVLAMNPGGGEAEVQDQLKRRKLHKKAGNPGFSQQAADQLRQYFAGQRRNFDVPVDLRGMPGFTTSVLAELRTIGFGKTLTYGEMARRVGNPKASRAVGQANGRNPVAIIVPCHRIVAGNGLGGFGGGLDVKRWLLRHEGRAELC